MNKLPSQLAQPNEQQQQQQQQQQPRPQQQQILQHQSTPPINPLTNNHQFMSPANGSATKSMMFGIPRQAPQPTAASIGAANFHPANLDSPFVDITLNNCEDLSLYQAPVAPPQQYHHASTMSYQPGQQYQQQSTVNNNNSPSEQLKPILKKQQMLPSPMIANNNSNNSYTNPNSINNSNLTSASVTSMNNMQTPVLSQQSAAAKLSLKRPSLSNLEVMDSSANSMNPSPYTPQQQSYLQQQTIPPVPMPLHVAPQQLQQQTTQSLKNNLPTNSYNCEPQRVMPVSLSSSSLSSSSGSVERPQQTPLMSQQTQPGLSFPQPQQQQYRQSYQTVQTKSLEHTPPTLLNALAPINNPGFQQPDKNHLLMLTGSNNNNVQQQPQISLSAQLQQKQHFFMNASPASSYSASSANQSGHSSASSSSSSSSAMSFASTHSSSSGHNLMHAQQSQHQQHSQQDEYLVSLYCTCIEDNRAFMNMNEILDLILNKDEPLNEHLYRIKQLQEKFNSLRVQSNVDNALFMSTLHQITNLNNQIDERKKLIRNAFGRAVSQFQSQVSSTSQRLMSQSSKKIESFHSNSSGGGSNSSSGYSNNNSMSMDSSHVNTMLSGVSCDATVMKKPFKNPFNIDLDALHGQSPLTVQYASLNSYSGMMMNNSVMSANQQQDVSDERTPTKNEGRPSGGSPHLLMNNTNNTTIGNNEEAEDDQDEDRSECENIFSAALKDLKEKNKNWSVNKCHKKNAADSLNESGQTSDASMMMAMTHHHHHHHFQMSNNFVSLLIDEYGDKNTSMNTKALAMKYLKNNPNFKEIIGGGVNSGALSSTNGCYNVIGSDNSLFFSSNDSTGVNQTVFKIFPSNGVSAINLNDISNMVTMHVPDENDASVVSDSNRQVMMTMPESMMLKPASTPFVEKASNKQPAVCSNEADGSSEEEADENGNESDEDEDDDDDNQSARAVNNSNNSNDDDDIWLFSKPNGKKNADNVPFDNTGFMSTKRLLAKQRAKNRKGKRFSDEDEDSDRDVTQVLDIDTLKRLPKLL
jgi:hypothetical protein